MMFTFQQPALLFLLALVPAVVALYLRAARRRAASLSTFSEGLTPSSPSVRAARIRHRWHAVGTSVGLALMIVALARPGWRPRQEILSKSGRDVVFVLDISRSMLAEDRAPNRLENMRLAILDCVKGFRGHRVALVVFAGTSAIKCPLTSDYEFFEAALRDVSPRSTSHGGTRVGDVLRKVADKLLRDDMRGFQDIVLITDGDDHDSRPGDVVDDLNTKMAGLVVIGVGAVDRGVRIPLVDPDSGGRNYVQYQSRAVLTRQNGALLQGLVQACDNGLYLDAGTRPVDLTNVYEQFAAHMGRREFTSDSIETREDEFPLFLGIAVVALLLSGAAPNVAARQRRAAVAAAASLLILASQAAAASMDGALLEARSAYDAGEFHKARELYAAVCRDAPERAEPCYNLGNSHYKAGDYTNALHAYAQALQSTTRGDLQFDCCYNIGNSLVRLAEGAFSVDAANAEDQLEEAARYYRAALELRPGSEDAAWNLECALCRREKLVQRRLLQAAMDKERREASETSEGDAARAADDEDDVTGEETDGEADDGSTRRPPASARALDLESRTLPPPNITPEQVLLEEAAINAIREKGREQTASSVKKDW
jgi:Ca-activated chloride channel homolog